MHLNMHLDMMLMILAKELTSLREIIVNVLSPKVSPIQLFFLRNSIFQPFPLRSMKQDTCQLDLSPFENTSTHTHVCVWIDQDTQVQRFTVNSLAG